VDEIIRLRWKACARLTGSRSESDWQLVAASVPSAANKICSSGLQARRLPYNHFNVPLRHGLDVSERHRAPRFRLRACDMCSDFGPIFAL